VGRAKPTPLVSIIMPFHNAEEYLGECLESIIAQTYKRWELIAVDDHSTDNSINIVRFFSLSDKRIKIFSNPVQGIVDALNHGLENSQGLLIARIDADDIMTKQRLSRQVGHLRENPHIGMVASLVDHFPPASNKKRKGYSLYVDWTNRLLTHEDHFFNRFVDSPVAHPSVMFRRELTDLHGCYKHGSFPEDYELWLRWMEEGVKIEKVTEVLLRWRDHASRLSRTSSNYSSSALQQTKAKYLKRYLDHLTKLDGRKLLCWGAGRVARKFYSLLKEYKVTISAFIEVDEKKIGRQVEGIPIISHSDIPKKVQCFVLILTGARNARSQITQFLEQRGYRLGDDFIPLA
jgi:glycosyltransferase involved in cell wall biosynthesis